MKRRSPFDSFERGLLLAHRGKEDDARERLGIAPEKPKRGRPKLGDEPVVATSHDQWCVVKLPEELAAQVERLAEIVDVNRTGFARLVLAAGIEAVLVSMEEHGGITLPLALKVDDRKRGGFRDFLRIITPERFTALCRRYPWKLSKWLPLHPGDSTGTPMPPTL